MRDINIAGVILAKRREKGMTQDELAAYIGVSKASVSKWETGQSYPDITILPQLANFFGITVDELIGYRPQLPREEIRRIYRELAGAFAERPFAEARSRCMELAHRYYACYPLVFQLGSLLVNHSMLAGDRDAGERVIAEAMELFARVKAESGDVALAKQARDMEAFCLLLLGRPQEVIERIGSVELQMTSEELLVKAYQMTGETGQARCVSQSVCYQHLIVLFQSLTDYLGLCAQELHTVQETMRRADALIAAFGMERLHPGLVLPYYLAAAQALTVCGDHGRGLDYLERYAALATGDIYPLCLHGDAYFDRLDDWFEQTLMLGADPPRDERTIRRSMVEAVEQPVFSAYENEARFQRLMRCLRENEREEEIFVRGAKMQPPGAAPAGK